jgi:hypothetical protein
MKTVELKKIVDREPFRPFSVRLSNGGAVHVAISSDGCATTRIVDESRAYS